MGAGINSRQLKLDLPERVSASQQFTGDEWSPATHKAGAALPGERPDNLGETAKWKWMLATVQKKLVMQPAWVEVKQEKLR